MADQYVKSMLTESERIILESRQHWFVLFRAILIEILLTIAIIVAVILGASQLAWRLGMFPLLLLIIPLVSGILDYLRWSNLQYIVTNRRVFRVSGILDKHVTDSSLEKVNDIRLDQSFWGRLFNFGELEILTASEQGIDVFTHLADPIKFKSALLNAKEDLDQYQAQPRLVNEQEDIPSIIAKLDLLRQQGIVSNEEFQLKKNELLRKL